MKKNSVAMLGAAVVCVAALSPAAVQADQKEVRWGIAIVVPFSGAGIHFNDSRLSAIYQNAKIKSGDDIAGYQLQIGSTLTKLDPFADASALWGKNCVYGALGVGYAKGTWAVPLALYGPFVSAGLANAGGLNGAYAGLNSLGCFDDFRVPAPAPAPAPVTPPPPPPPVETAA